MSPAQATVVFAVAHAVLTWGGVQPAGAGDAVAERAGVSAPVADALRPVVPSTSLPELVAS